MSTKMVCRAALLMLLALASAAGVLGQPLAETEAHPDSGYDWQAEMTQPEAAPASTSPAGYVSVLDVLGKLIVALAVAWGLVHLLRWWQQHRTGTLPGERPCGRHICVEETLSLGADGRLHLVDVDGRRLLLASNEQGVRQIADLTVVDAEPAPSIYHSARPRPDGTVDEVNIARSPIRSRPIRADLGREGESWELRRDRLLAELQER